MSTRTRRAYIHSVFERQCEIGIQNLARIHSRIGDAVDCVYVCGTDFGTQTSSFCSVATFRELWFPYYKRVNDWVHANTSWKCFKHSCGSVERFLESLIEAGFDIINPVQCSAAGMEPAGLKRKYGSRLVFWGGGVDTQKTLPFGTPQEVREEVLRRCEIFAPGGGFVFNSIHNLQAGYAGGEHRRHAGCRPSIQRSCGLPGGSVPEPDKLHEADSKEIRSRSRGDAGAGQGAGAEDPIVDRIPGAGHGRGGPPLRVRRVLRARDAALGARHEGVDGDCPPAAGGERRRSRSGRVVIGTVKGDLHDIGKNLVASMLEGGGFEVIDLGADVAPEKFVEAVRSGGARIVCLSALLTVTMTGMRATIEALQQAGMRDRVRVLIGGAPVTAQFARDIGADGYGENANAAVSLARQMMAALN